MSLENKDSKNKSALEKTGPNLENGLTKNQLIKKLEDFGRKKGIYILGAMATFMVASNPAKAQTLEKQTYNVTMPDGSHKIMTEREALEYAKNIGGQVTDNGRNIDPNVGLKNLDNYENTHRTAKYPINNRNSYQGERQARPDTSIERGANNIEQKIGQLADTFVLLPFRQGVEEIKFNTYQELLTFIANHNLNYIASHIGLIKNGQRSRLSNTSFFQQHKNEIIADYNNNYRHNSNNNPNYYNQNNPNNPQNNQENTNNNQEKQRSINYNYYFQSIPMGKGQILNYSDDGSATLYSSSKKYRTITLKKLSNQSQVLNHNPKNSSIDINKLFSSIQESIPLGKTGKIIQDNGNGTATEYKVSINKRGDEIKITRDRMIRVF